MSDTREFSALDPELNGEYQIDPAHSRIGFVARYAMVTKVRGGFNQFTGTLTLSADEPAKSAASLTIDADSVDTRNEQRDAHLRTKDFFDVAAFPQIRFTSTSIVRTGEVEFLLSGDLTVKGVTQPIQIECFYGGITKDIMGNMRVGFEGSSEVNRRDFGMTFTAVLEAGGVLVSDKIGLEFEVSATKVIPET